MGPVNSVKGAPGKKNPGASPVWTIYCHIHIETGRRYIGLTSQTVMQRWNRHVCDSRRLIKGYGHFRNAIRKYGKDAFSHEVLEVCTSLEVANLAEKCWIEFFDTRNLIHGFNLARGGEHTPRPIRNNPWDNPEFRAQNLPRFVAAGQSPEARARAKASLNTPESRAKRSASTRVSMNSLETVAKRAAMREDGTLNARISASVCKALEDPEKREKIVRGFKRNHEDPKLQMKRKTALLIAMQNPETKQKLSEVSNRSWANPEYRARHAARVVSEETRARISAASIGFRHSPESLQRMKDIKLIHKPQCKFCHWSIGSKPDCGYCSMWSILNA